VTYGDATFSAEADADTVLRAFTAFRDNRPSPKEEGVTESKIPLIAIGAGQVEKTPSNLPRDLQKAVHEGWSELLRQNMYRTTLYVDTYLDEDLSGEKKNRRVRSTPSVFGFRS
jgi:hypothetical protein